MAIFVCLCYIYNKASSFFLGNKQQRIFVCIIFSIILKHHRLRSICLQQKQVALLIMDHQEAVDLDSSAISRIIK